MTAIPTIQPAVFKGASNEVRNAVQLASAETGVSFSYLMAKAAVESGYRTDVKAPTSSATGLFQVIERTWLTMVQEHGSKYGLEAQAAKVEGAAGDPEAARGPDSLGADGRRICAREQGGASALARRRDRRHRTLSGSFPRSGRCQKIPVGDAPRSGGLCGGHDARGCRGQPQRL